VDRETTALLEAHLRQRGLLDGALAAGRRPELHEAAEKALATRPSDLHESWIHWSGKRKCVALLQLLARDASFVPGPIDGWWGPQTNSALQALRVQVATGAAPRPWRDDLPGEANPNNWPSEAEVEAFYGPPGKPDGSFRPPLIRVPTPWTLKFAWNRNRTRSFLWCHEKAAPSLARVLDRVFARYGAVEIERLRLFVFSGDYAARRMRCGTRWSMHAWGIAFDFDDENNGFDWGRDRCSFAGDAYLAWWEIWEAEGWVSLGRSRNFDWMHVQAARL
jgi:hypothetical protein